MSLHILDTPIAGLKIVERRPHRDERGFLVRLFDAADLGECGWHRPIEQLNHTHTRTAGTIRGMHYQLPPYAEMKLVSCIRGKIWDVAIDLRADSPTFMHWHAEILSPENGRALLVPEGFAHGFQSLEDDSEIVYCNSAPYVPGSEGGVLYSDDQVGIEWPLPPTVISDRDQKHPMIQAGFSGIVV